MAEPDESRIWKYVELPQIFQLKAGEINITSKQHLRICQKLADHVARQKPKNPKEFEQVEYLKNFVVKSAELNEQTIALLDYLKPVIQEICNDATSLLDGAALNRIIRDQGEKILKVMDERDEYLHKYYGIIKSQRGENTAVTK